MRAVIQCVKNAKVTVAGELAGAIGQGILVYLGVETGDSEQDAAWLAEKAANLRIFEDDEGKMNLSCLDLGLEALVVSQFTLLADARKGRRPSYNRAAPPEEAERLYKVFVDNMEKMGLRCATGVFRTHMEVTYTNDGPVTIIIDTRERTNP